MCVNPRGALGVAVLRRKASQQDSARLGAFRINVLELFQLGGVTYRVPTHRNVYADVDVCQYILCIGLWRMFLLETVVGKQPRCSHSIVGPGIFRKVGET